MTDKVIMEESSENNRIRLGKHEKKVLDTLRFWLSVNPEWSWHKDSGYLRKLASDDHIECYERGDIVPVWMLLRDCIQCKATLSRVLRSLERKGLITRRGGDLDGIWGGFGKRNTKFVSLISKR